MKKFLVVTLLTVGMSCLAFGQGKDMKSSGKAEEEIMKLEDQWVKTRATKDPTTTKSLLSEDFLGSNPDGMAQTKQQFIDSVVAGNFAAGNPEYAERKVRIYGETAVSTGLVTGAGQSGTDKIRFMRVFVKRNGQWQIVATQATRVAGGQ
jgi:hypothetical protein